jgi:hypothetical protein
MPKNKMQNMNALSFVTVVGLHELGDPTLLRKLLKKLALKVALRRQHVKMGRKKSAAGYKEEEGDEDEDKELRSEVSAAVTALSHNMVDVYVDSLLLTTKQLSSSSLSSSSSSSSSSSKAPVLLRRNASGTSPHTSQQEVEGLEVVEHHFTGEQARLEELTGIDFPW